MSRIEWIGSLNTVHRSRGLSAMCVCNSRLIWQEKITIENSLTQRDAIVVHLLHILAGLSFFFFFFLWLHKSVKSPCRHQGFDLKTSWQVRFNYASFCMSSIPRNEIITQLGSTSTELMLFQYTAHRPLMSLYLLPYLSRSIFPHNCPLKWHRAVQKHQAAMQIWKAAVQTSCCLSRLFKAFQSSVSETPYCSWKLQPAWIKNQVKLNELRVLKQSLVCRGDAILITGLIFQTWSYFN